MLKTLQGLIECAEEQVGVLLAEHHGRADLQDVVVYADPVYQNPTVAHRVDEALGLGARRLTGLPILHHLDCEEHTATPYIANDCVLFLKLVKARDDIRADSLRVLEQSLIS